MVKITDGVQVLEVPNGAYKNTFKALGYRIIAELKEAPGDDPRASEGHVDEAPEAKGAPEEASEIEEKPIAQWNKHEVKAFAQAHGIDLTGTKTIDEAKDRIKKSMGL